MTKNALDLINEKYYKSAEEVALLEEARADESIAIKLRELRKAKGLTQRELANLVGTTPSVISRLEDAEYDGHSLSMLRRIATNLGAKVSVTFSTTTEKHRTA